MAEDLGERTEEPTQRRLMDARERGTVAKSSDLAAAVFFGLAVVGLVVAGGLMADEAGLVTRRMLSSAGPADPLLADDVRADAAWALGRAAVMAGPMLAMLMVAGALGYGVQVGFLLTSKPLEPNLTRLSPLAGIKRILGPRGLAKGLASVAKLAFVVAVTTLFVVARWERLVGVASLEALLGMRVAAGLGIELVLWLVAVVIVLGVLDYAVQRVLHQKDHRMTKQEVREERKSMDGDPEVRARRQRMARQIALQRINRDVPKADVVVTNPTHYSVALRYSGGSMRAPKVVAKGADELAWRIRQLATVHGVAIVERPPLARELYRSVRVGQEIRPEHYEAVAEVLAHVYRVGKRAAA